MNQLARIEPVIPGPIARPCVPYKRAAAEIVANGPPATATVTTNLPHWTDVIGAAKRAAVDAYGADWWRHPDAAVTITLTDAARRVAFLDREGKRRYRKTRKDMTVPQRRFWPFGIFPQTLVVTPIRRYDPSSVLSRMDGRWKGPMAQEDYWAWVYFGLLPSGLKRAPGRCPHFLPPQKLLPAPKRRPLPLT